MKRHDLSVTMCGCGLNGRTAPRHSGTVAQREASLLSSTATRTRTWYPLLLVSDRHEYSRSSDVTRLTKIEQCAGTHGLETVVSRTIRDFEVDSRLDLACVLKHGTVDVLYDGRPHIAVSPPNCTLIFFLPRLLARLQSVGTVPAMDLNAYAKWLGR